MALPVPDLLKRLAIFLFMQVLGAIQALKEQTVDRHRPLKRESQKAQVLYLTLQMPSIDLIFLSKILQGTC